MPSITWSGNFNGTAAGSAGKTATLSSSSTLPTNAVVQSVTYSVNVSAGWTDASFYWTLHWFYVQYGSTNGAHKGTIGTNAAYDTIQCQNIYSGGTNQNITGTLTFDNASVFRNTSITCNVKANIPQSGSPTTYMNAVSVTVNYVIPSITWGSGASLSYTTSGPNATFTFSGSATATPSSATITYKLFTSEAGDWGTFNSSKQITVNVGVVTNLLFWVQAQITVSGTTYYSSNNPEKQVTVSGPNLAFGSGASLSFSGSNGNATVTLSGSATVTNGYTGLTVYYQLFEYNTKQSKDVQRNSDGSTAKTWTYTPLSGLDVTTTWSVKAYVIYNNNRYYNTGDPKTVRGMVSSPWISWPSGAKITFTNSPPNAVISRPNNATLNGGYSATVYYSIWCGSTRKNNDGDTSSSWSIVPPSYGTSYTYKVQAYATVSGTTYTSTDLTVSGAVSAPALSWSSGANITVTQSGSNAVVTLNGSAVVSSGYSATPYYRVWFGSTRKNTDSDTSKSWTGVPPAYDTAVTYKVQGYITYSGIEYVTSDLTKSAVIEGSKYISYYDGSGWVQCKVYYYDGSNWVECEPYYYDGSSWVEISS